MVVGVCRLTVLVAYSHSLKQKRGAVRKIKDRVRAKFGLDVAEVGGLDTWQRAVLGFSVVANDRRHVDSVMERVVQFVGDTGVGELTDDERDVFTYGDDG